MFIGIDLSSLDTENLQDILISVSEELEARNVKVDTTEKYYIDLESKEIRITKAVNKRNAKNIFSCDISNVKSLDYILKDYKENKIKFQDISEKTPPYSTFDKTIPLLVKTKAEAPYTYKIVEYLKSDEDEEAKFYELSRDSYEIENVISWSLI